MIDLGPSGPLAGSIDGYEDRPAQRAMADAVARCLAGAQPLLVEAGTGTGKTLAYLAPAIASGLRVVVSTGTRTLQDQLVRKDLPVLERALGPVFHAAVLKGVSNYVCVRKLEQIGGLAVDGNELDTVRLWAWRTATGDRSELADVPEDATAWDRVTTTPDVRLGPRCPHYERCFVTRARREADKADLVIVNHHLFFADLALRATFPGARVLPEYDAVVFDEAHQIEDVATEHFGINLSTQRLAALVRDARAVLRTPRIPDVIERRARELFALVAAHLPQGTSVNLPDELFEREESKNAWFLLDAALEELHAEATAADEDDPVSTLAVRTAAARADLAAVAERERAQHVHWAELRGAYVALRASPIHVGELLRKHLHAQVPATIFTSATLTAAGSFRYVRDRLGLDPELTEELGVASPFDYARQALLYLPRDLPLPGDPSFTSACCARLAELAALFGGRCFGLFTTWRALHAAARRLRGALPYPVLVQGDGPRGALLESFARQPSVLLATGAFWEGVDVPGDALSCVVIDKLPFAPPDDPLAAARMRAVEEAGGDAFADYQLPQAALALKQGFGRLIRRADDRGVVAVLDSRIVMKRYGQVFLDTLPTGLPRTSALEQVRRWVVGAGGWSFDSGLAPRALRSGRTGNGDGDGHGNGNGNGHGHGHGHGSKVGG